MYGDSLKHVVEAYLQIVTRLEFLPSEGPQTIDRYYGAVFYIVLLSFAISIEELEGWYCGTS